MGGQVPLLVVSVVSVSTWLIVKLEAWLSDAKQREVKLVFFELMQSHFFARAKFKTEVVGNLGFTPN